MEYQLNKLLNINFIKLSFHGITNTTPLNTSLPQQPIISHGGKKKGKKKKTDVKVKKLKIN